MNYNELLALAIANGFVVQHLDRITIEEYQDENGAIAWRDIHGTVTDDKGRRFTVTANGCTVSRETIEAILKDMRDGQDFEFCVKFELITIRG